MNDFEGIISYICCLIVVLLVILFLYLKFVNDIMSG
jgi:hypothetical protein